MVTDIAIPHELKRLSAKKLWHTIATMGPKPQNNLEFTLQDTLSDFVIRQANATGIVRRFGSVVPVNFTMDNVPIRKLPTVQHFPRYSETAASNLSMDVGFVDPSPVRNVVNMKVSSELLEDARPGSDLLTYIGEAVGTAIAKAEDRNAFSGDTSESTGYINGILNSLNASSIHTAAGGNTSAATLDVDDFADAMGLLPELDAPPPRWYMSRSFYTKSALRLGGTNSVNATIPEDADAFFLGHKCHFVPGMPDKDAAAGSLVACFGYLDQSTVLMDYGDMSVREGDIFETDQTWIRAKNHTSFVCWDRGSTDSSDPAGAMVALQLAET